MIGTSKQLCWLAEACQLLPLLLMVQSWHIKARIGNPQRCHVYSAQHASLDINLDKLLKLLLLLQWSRLCAVCTWLAW